MGREIIVKVSLSNVPNTFIEKERLKKKRGTVVEIKVQLV